MSGSHCIRILGRELQVRSSATPETVQEIEAFVNDTVARVESRVRGGDRLGVAILSLMTLAEEHLAVIKKQDRNKCNTEQVVELIRTIDEVLSGAA
ncbi:cell division protein ZapA [Geobacter argillaceus]|uniref:Cell division protein ZapA n=1 Tax=Geobacter argillaceus TaxID=345631 RepID=A0A562V6Q5_9BACT|nr:cell division protein ZapA [Geobacter argillaceus]TWJ13522.1 cell division protein ZapA [Geobacter argillaceus]